MNAIWLLLVSASLFYNNISENSAATKDDCANILRKHTVLKPYMSVYDKMFEASSSDGTCSNKSRNVLSAIVRKTLIAPFTPESWEAISKYENKKEINKYKDSSEKAFTVFYNLCGLISIKLGEWLSELDPCKMDTVEYYFGYDEEMQDIINISITELMSQERKGNIYLDNFFMVFYKLLDLKNVHVEQSKPDRAKIISYSLKIFYDNLEENMKSESKEKGEKQMKQDLMDSLCDIEEKVNPSFGVTIPGMKMWLLSQTTDNIHLKAIQNLKPARSDQRTLSDYVRSYAHEFDVYIVNEYHVSILSVLIPHMFRYVHNYFMLLLKLEKYLSSIDVNEENVITEFLKFMTGYMSVFVERFFEFKGEISQEIVDALLPILFFLNPTVPHCKMGKNFTKNEIETLRKLENPDVSTLNDYIKNTKNTTPQKSITKLQVVEHMKELIYRADTVILKSFTVYNTNETIDAWDEELGKKLENKKQTKETVMNEIDKNNNEALSILILFSNAFTV